MGIVAGSLRRDPLVDEAERLLVTLFNVTVRGMRVNEPDSRRFDEIAERAGMGTVGNPSSVAKAALAFKDAAAAGLVEPVKDPDGPLRYKVSRLGERYVMQAEFERMERSWREQSDSHERRAAHHEDEERRLRAKVENLERAFAMAKTEIETLETLLARARTPWWRKLRRKAGAS